MGKQQRKGQPPHKGRGAGAPPPPAPPAVGGGGADLEVDEEDIAFIRSHRRQLGFLSSAALDSDAPDSKRRKKPVPQEEEGGAEELYERTPRVAAAWKEAEDAGAAVDALPTRTEDGAWVYKTADARAHPKAAVGDKRARAADDAADERGGAAPARRQAADATRAPAAAVLVELQEQELSLAQKKERIAAACTALMEAPERNVSELKVLHRLAMDAHPVVAKLASLSAMLVYKDLAPGYRIRLPTEKELEMAVSKEVRATRDYETAFLKAYQSFLQLLLAAAGGADGGAAPAPAKKKAAAGALDARTALRCMCCLLQALPQFNYRSDLLRALVPRLAAEDVAEAGPAVAAVTSVLREDSHGEATLEAVQLLADLVKRLGCTAPAHTLDALKAVRFDENLGARLKDEREKDKPLSQKQRNRKWIEERRRMRDDAKRAARKPGADAKGAARGSGGGDDDEGEVEDRTLRDFDALPDTTARLQLQTSTLEATCEIYFRVLKDAAAPDRPTGRPLVGATFAGLARVAHLIDYEVVADILEVLRKLLAKGDLVPELRARCLLAACDVLGGQGAALAVDTRDFHRHLYHLAELPPSLASAVSWAGSFSAPLTGETGVDASRLWVRALSTMLLARSQRQVDTERVAAFAKRLTEVAFGAETGESMSALAVVCELLNRHPKLRRLLENESGAARSYLPEVTEPESACALSSCLWELALLQRHAHPSVALLATHVAAMPVEDAAPPAPFGAMSPEEVSVAFSTSLGGFRPAVPAPRAGTARRPARDTRGAALVTVLSEAEAAQADVDPALLRAQFREARAFQENAALRAEAARLGAQLKKFRLHLQAAPAAAGAAAGRKGAKKSKRPAHAQ